ncbi:hypothetical protein DTL21_11920 [Bremerella cremea]|uniref:Macroglobulin domain-containing protein n=2 Tax=Pirellulales TaxID=2691354 RepID=A0A2S8FQW6_9BACT|nr:hypothetical protein C5Y83_11915 [Blastopirellula marina]RCS46730.1 hypothetical protein DTL21_11920 [Bremerella cremea]
MPAYHFATLSLLTLLSFAFFGTPSFAEELGKLELVLTYGESGLPRDNVFYTGEKVFATLRITGLGDERPYTGQIQVTGMVLDANGEEVLRVEKEPEYYSQVLGGDSIETTLIIDSDKKGIAPGNYTLVSTIQQMPAGRKWEVQTDFRWETNPILHCCEFAWFLDRECKYPAAPVMQPGRFFWLRQRFGHFSFVDRSFSIQAQMKLVRRNNQPVKAEGGKGSYSFKIPPASELPEWIWLPTFEQFTRPGNCRLSLDIADLLSGTEASTTLPVYVGKTPMPSVESNGDLKPFLALTHGKYGNEHDSDYLMGEDIWVTLGFIDKTRGGVTNQKIHAYFLDQNNQVVSDFSLGEVEIRCGFHERYFIKAINFAVNPDRGPVEPVRKVQIELHETTTGAKTVLSAPIRFLPMKELAALNLRVSRDTHDKVPAGQFLTAGQPYYLNCDITKFTVKDYAIDITHSVKAFTEDGQPIAGTELVLEHKRALSVAEKLNEQLPLGMQISLNRPGKFLLRSTFTDNLSGRTYTSDMPIEVVSPFQFVADE